MASVELAVAAVEDLDHLVSVLSLPSDARQRVRRSLEDLERLPLLGPQLGGQWHGLRSLIGPWRWMVLVYHYEPERDRVVVVTIQDARSSGAAPTSRP